MVDLTASSVAARVSPEAIAAAALVLRRGGLAAFPTETVYGLGGDATSPEAIAKIYAAKGRPQFNPLISHVVSHAAAQAEGLFTPEAHRLAEAFWPGPLTLILPRQPGGAVCDLACAGLATLGLRVPSHRVALALLHETGRPVAAPSANRSGRISPTCAADVEADFASPGFKGETIHVLDGGSCLIGVESTIVSCLRGEVNLLRPGGLTAEAIETVLGRPPGVRTAKGIEAPGLLISHYAPRARMRLDARELRPGEAGLDFGGILAGAGRDLSAMGDLQEAAANLYRDLRALDATGSAVIAVAPIPGTGLGLAINDRLRRAAAPRD